MAQPITFSPLHYIVHLKFYSVSKILSIGLSTYLKYDLSEICFVAVRSLLFSKPAAADDNFSGADIRFPPVVTFLHVQ